MFNINLSNWGDFEVGDLFNIKPTKSYNLSNAGLIDGGQSPVVVNSAYNNGIGGKSTKKTTELGNMITFSDTVDANTIFYQEYPFIGYSHVQGLYPIGKYTNNWTKESLLFFVSSFKKSALIKGFDYGNKFKRDIAKKIKVKLPIDSNGEPDWQYMENYIHNIENKVKNSLFALSLTTITSEKKIDISNWGDFRLGKINKNGKFNGTGLFDIFNSVAYHTEDVEEINEDNKTIGLNYVTRSKFNNGIKFKIIKKNTYILNPAGTISFGAENANFFYQEEDYITGNKMYYIDTRNLSKNCCLFIKTILETTFTNNFSYSDAMIPSRIYDEIIKLPIDSKGNPDWDYMENYINNINIQVKRNLEILDFYD